MLENTLWPYWMIWACSGMMSLMLKEFSESLTGRAFSWYAKLKPNSVCTWEEMAREFCNKFFWRKKLHPCYGPRTGNTKQQRGSHCIHQDILGQCDAIFRDFILFWIILRAESIKDRKLLLENEHIKN